MRWATPRPPRFAAGLMGAGAVLALVWSAVASPSYATVTRGRWGVGAVSLSLSSLATQGLMTVFFLGVGLELAREFLGGHRRHFAAPVLAALGGMVGAGSGAWLVGSLGHYSALTRGWSIPMATDVAFALAGLALVGKGLPRGLRTFILTLALADDLFSVVVVSTTTSAHVHALPLVSAGVVIAIALATRRRTPPVVFALTVTGLTWILLAAAGVEPALAGAVGGLLTPPVRQSAHLEALSARFTSDVVLPVFAFVASGLPWTEVRQAGGVIGLIAVVRIGGKVLGITLVSLLAPRLGLPHGLRPSEILGGSLLCAMGFTIPLLIASRLFGAASATYGAFAAGLDITTVLGGILGVVVLRRVAALNPPPEAGAAPAS